MRLLLSLLLLLPLIHAEIIFSVEEPSMHPKGRHRHSHHKHRHQRDHPGGATTRDQPILERFSLNCPHMADADKKDVHIEVTWTLDDTVWLKIRDGEQIVYFNRTTFQKKALPPHGKTVVRVELAAGRYMFHYDELTGDFMMEINEVQPLDDFGTWECLVTRRQGSSTSSESTRKTIVAPPGAHERRAAAAAAAASQGTQQRTTAGYRIPSEQQRQPAGPRARIDYGSDSDREQQTRTTQKFSAFSRPDQNSVQISRDTVDRRRQTVVFDRSITTKDYRQHAVDYELSMAVDDDENDDFHYESAFSKHARAAAIGANGAPCAGALLATLTIAAAALYRL